jgi:hypothetical protein
MSRSLGLREDQQVGATLMMRINALFPVPSAINVASGLIVARGLVPRWAAQRPQCSQRISSDKLC